MRTLLLVAALFALLLPPDRAAAAEVGVVYFPQTGHQLADDVGFLTYWRAYGQLVRFGYPITEQIQAEGKVVQFFERVRMEWTPEAGVQLGLLGVEAGAAQAPVDPGTPGFMPATGHSLTEEFADYWARHRGIALFGYPISEAYLENGRWVQWFERTKLEYHPEVMRPLWAAHERSLGIDLDPLYEMQAAALGWDSAARWGVSTAAAERRPGVRDWHPSLWQRRIEVSLSSYTLRAYEGDLLVLWAPVAIGRPGFETVAGSFRVDSKWWAKTMTGNERGESWDVPDVPFTQFFYRDWAIHGTYWHTSWGSRRSHGCVNLPLEQAEWLFNWSSVGVPVTVAP